MSQFPRTSLIAFRLEERDNLRLRRICREQGVSMSDFIRHAVTQAINKHNLSKGEEA